MDLHFLNCKLQIHYNERKENYGELNSVISIINNLIK